MRRIGTGGARPAVALALLVWASGCGGQVGDESRTAGAPSAARPELPASPPRTAATAPRSASPAEPPRSSPALIPAPEMPRSRPAETYGLSAKDAVENVLSANCGACHGPAVVGPGIHFINDLDRLVAAGLIVPLSAASSRIVRVMVDGSMPPPSSGLPFVTEADINTVAAYIDNPRFWPDLSIASLQDAGADGG